MRSLLVNLYHQVKKFSTNILRYLKNKVNTLCKCKCLLLNNFSSYEYRLCKVIITKEKKLNSEKTKRIVEETPLNINIYRKTTISSVISSQTPAERIASKRIIWPKMKNICDNNKNTKVHPTLVIEVRKNVSFSSPYPSTRQTSQFESMKFISKSSRDISIQRQNMNYNIEPLVEYLNYRN